MIELLGQGGRLGVAIGVAGVGKSTILAPLVDAWREDGRRVYGMALAWRQTDDLVQAGIAEGDRATEVFLERAKDGRIALDRCSVAVNSGNWGARQFLDLMRLQARRRFQVD